MRKLALVFVLLLPKVVFAWDWWEEKKVIAAVFHESFCESLGDSLDAYVATVEQRGYTVIKLCTPTSGVERLREKIKVAVFEKEISWGQLKGINLFGPVLKTRVLPHLHRQNQKDVFASQVLAFDDLEFIYVKDHVVDIRGSYFMPPGARWVSHQFADEGLSWQDVRNKLLVSQEAIASSEKRTRGDEYLHRLVERMNAFRSSPLDDWHTFTGVGGGAVIMALIPSFMYVASAGRGIQGYSEANRYQTAGDSIGTPVLNAGYAGLFIASVSVIFRRLFLIYALPEEDVRWKRAIFKEGLKRDGLIQSDSDKNKAP